MKEEQNKELDIQMSEKHKEKETMDKYIGQANKYDSIGFEEKKTRKFMRYEFSGLAGAAVIILIGYGLLALVSIILSWIQ